MWSELSSNISTMILFCMYDGECRTLCCRNKKWRNFLFSRMYWGWTPIHYCPDPVKLCPQNLPNSDKKKSFLQANTCFFAVQIYIVYKKNPNIVWELYVFSFNQPNIISLAAMEWKWHSPTFLDIGGERTYVVISDWAEVEIIQYIWYPIFKSEKLSISRAVWIYMGRRAGEPHAHSAHLK